jgi:Fic family protein
LATTAIEGNTLSEEQVLDAIDGKLEVPPSLEYQKQEVQNIIRAFNEVQKTRKSGPFGHMSQKLVCDYNGLVLDGLELGDGTIPGVLREHQVVVGRAYKAVHAEDCPYLLDRLCGWLNGPDFQLPEGWHKNGGKAFAIVKSIVAHLYLAWIHPFGDGNGRTARLLEFHILLAAGVHPAAAHLLSNHYNSTRQEYYRQLGLASKSKDIIPFLEYAVTGFVDGLQEQLNVIMKQHWGIVWENYVNDFFGEVKSEFRRRQRKLALVLGKVNEWVKMGDIPNISIDTARIYSGKTLRAIKRDVEYLQENKMLEVKSNEVRVNRNIALTALPQET